MVPVGGAGHRPGFLLVIFHLYPMVLLEVFSLLVGDAMVVSRSDMGEKVNVMAELFRVLLPKFSQLSVYDCMMVVGINMG